MPRPKLPESELARTTTVACLRTQYDRLVECRTRTGITVTLLVGMALDDFIAQRLPAIEAAMTAAAPNGEAAKAEV